MGVINTAISGLKAIVGVLIFISFVPSLPPNVKYDSYVVKPILPLKGVLSINDKLNNVEQMFKNEMKGPEAFLVYNNELYTGIHGGFVVKIVNDKMVPVVKFGNKCEGFYEESICGRPLGLFIDIKEQLYVVDSYFGIYRHNLTSGESERLVAADDNIEGKATKLLNSVAVSKDGIIYYTLSSTHFTLEDGLYTTLGSGSGRVIKYDPVTKSSEVLLEDLHFANGILISDDEHFLLIAETMRSRLIRFYLKGPKKGTHDIFVDGLPGLPDNLQKDNKGGFISPLVFPVDENNPCIFQQLSEYPYVRRFLGRLLFLLELPFAAIQQFYPNYYTAIAKHWIGHFESLDVLLGKPTRITVLFINKDGKITKSLHGTDMKISGISDFIEWNGYYYLGSPFNTFLGRVKAI
uniref:Strictosidine synthase conserved region domain-containing protein n=1 Tax=Clastoptera arizonana TaxID=38151 RepID=A0A1B6C3Z5_9HEMI